jgi:hypothetical protein
MIQAEQMDKERIMATAVAFQKVFSERDLNALGKEIGLCERERSITPFKLGLSIVTSLACNQVESLADLQRDFNALIETEIGYKAFYNQLAKAEFPEMMRAVTSLAIKQMSFNVLGFREGSPFHKFQQILVHDGSSFALKDALKESFPGRFSAVSPASVELHTTMDLLSDTAVRIVLTPDTESEQVNFPDARKLKDCLFLGDRGYVNLSYMHEVDQNGGSFIIRGKKGLNPWVMDAWGEDGKRPRRLRNKTLNEVLDRLPKRQATDLKVGWVVDGEPRVFRMIVTWNSQTKEYQYLITNLDYRQFSIQDVCLAYHLRWQVELLFKEWKSYANLHAFDTANPDIAEGLIWASIIAAALKRFLAHATQLACRVATSTRKVAMCAAHPLKLLVNALKTGSLSEILTALQKGLSYLAINALRAHPKRDRKSGRSQLGLEPLLQE